MGLNLSNHQISTELDLNQADVQQMTTQLRSGIVANKPAVSLAGEVECDEVYVIAGHKGQPEIVKKKVEQDDAVLWNQNRDEERWQKKNFRLSGWFNAKEK